LAYTTKATAYTGDMYRFPGVVASKYCIGGVSGNETTMILVPLLASLGITMPKTFSRSITSPAATGECVEVLMQSELKKAEIIRLVESHGACLAWNGNLNLAPANDRIIKVSAPLGMEPYARMISSIMAKNYAMGINHCLIDIPVGPTAKVTNQKAAKRIAKHFKTIGAALGIKTEVAITKAEQPIGNGIGAVLQVREVLRILQQHPERALDLEEKALDLASQLLVLCKHEKYYRSAYKRAKAELLNGNAWKKMQSLIQAQKGSNPEISSEALPLAPHILEVAAPSAGKIKAIDMKYLNMLARTLGAPGDASAGLFLHAKLGKKVQAGDLLFTCYSSSENKLKMAKELLEEQLGYEIH
ncbi:MAG: thymidine phosphorylase, partial [candidate division SR1 bacterium]